MDNDVQGGERCFSRDSSEARRNGGFKLYSFFRLLNLELAMQGRYKQVGQSAGTLMDANIDTAIVFDLSVPFNILPLSVTHLPLSLVCRSHLD